MAVVTRVAQLLIACLAANADWDTDNTSQDWPRGCFRFGLSYDTPVADITMPITDIKTPKECQAKCEELAECTDFGYFPKTNQCWLGAGGLLQQTPGGIAGPKRCPSDTSQGGIYGPKACIETPAANFFAADSVNDSTKYWKWTNPTEYQPSNFQCWPHSIEGSRKACGVLAVVEDTTVGWPGHCTDLEKVEATAGCEETCRTNPTCSVWQVRDGECYQGLGKNCHGAAPTIAFISRSQRLARGQFRVVAEVKGVKIVGLTNVETLTNLSTKDQAAAQAACPKICLSQPGCQFWQWSSTSGCWIDNAPLDFHDTPHVAWPLLKENAPVDAEIIAGQYFQRDCQATASAPFEAPADVVAPATPAPTAVVVSPTSLPWTTQTTTPDEASSSSSGSGSSDSMQWWGWLLLALAALALLGAVIAASMCGGKKKSSKRNARVRSSKKYQPAQALVPAPVPLEEAAPLVSNNNATASALFDQFDTNHDGVLSAAEYGLLQQSMPQLPQQSVSYQQPAMNYVSVPQQQSVAYMPQQSVTYQQQAQQTQAVPVYAAPGAGYQLQQQQQQFAAPMQQQQQQFVQQQPQQQQAGYQAMPMGSMPQY